MRRKFLWAFLAIGVFSMSLQASDISLTNDFSISNGNPNGQWAYKVSGANLTLQIPLQNGNSLIPALSTGYWGGGTNLNYDTPELFKALVNGSSAGETDNAFLAGDIVGHSSNDGSPLYEIWTAPSAGIITNLNLLMWYAHPIINRSNDYALYHNNSLLTSGTVSATQNSTRDTAAHYTNDLGFPVAAGDVITLGLAKSGGQEYGSLTGESLNFTFTPSSCSPGSKNLCLNQGRFFVEVDWSTAAGAGKGTAVPLTSDAGYFWFFGDTNVELLVKILDGRGVNGHFWFFWGAMTDVQYTITVTDVLTSTTKTYQGAQGIQKSGNDVNAF